MTQGRSNYWTNELRALRLRAPVRAEERGVRDPSPVSEADAKRRRRVHLLEDALITITRSKVVPGSAGWALSDAVDEYLPFRDGLPLDGRESREVAR